MEKEKTKGEVVVGYALTNNGDLLISENGGFDWETLELKKESLHFMSQDMQESTESQFEIESIIKGNRGVLYLFSESQHILLIENCSKKVIVMNSLPSSRKFTIKKLLVHKDQPFHLLLLVEMLLCPLPEQCYFGNVVYYSQEKNNLWVKLMEDVEDVVWAKGSDSANFFGILMILNESVSFKTRNLRRSKQNNKTVAVYSNNFFIDKFR